MYLIYAFVFLVAAAAIWVVVRWYRSRAHETDPIKSRLRQAARMKWRETGTVKEDGYGAAWTKRSVRFVRGKEEAVLWHKDATITLVRDYAPPTLDDFVELEQWIKRNPRDPEVDTATGERLYLREIERFVIRLGHFSSLLETTATDKDFFMAIATFHKAGYLAQEAPVVIAALTLEALMRYEKDRRAAMRFLSGLKKDIGAGTSDSQAE